MIRPALILDHRFDAIDAARDIGREKVGPAHESGFLDLVDPLAKPGTETPGQRAAQDEAELPAAAITSVQSHRCALLPCDGSAASCLASATQAVGAEKHWIR
jgi:hypothetical protein